MGLQLHHLQSHLQSQWRPMTMILVSLKMKNPRKRMPRQLERHNLWVLMTTQMEATQRVTKKSRIWAVTTTGRTSHHLRSSREMEKVREEARASTKAKAKAKAKVKTRAK